MPKPNSTDLASFFDNLELVRITLIESSAWRSDTVQLPAEVHIEHKVAIGKGTAGSSWAARCQYDLQATPNQGTEVQLKISATYSVLYTARGRLDDKMRSLLAENGVLATWPYVRHLVRSFTADMELAPLDIGLYKVKFKANNLHGPAKENVPARPSKETSKAKRSDKQ